MISNGFVDRCSVFEGSAEAFEVLQVQTASQNLLIYILQMHPKRSIVTHTFGSEAKHYEHLIPQAKHLLSQ